MREDKKKGWKFALWPRCLIFAVGMLLLALTDVSCGSGTETSSGSASAVVVNSSGGMLIAASAINFARNAVVGGGASGDPLISQQQANEAMAQANRMLRELEAKNPAIARESPTAAFVIEHPDDHFIAKPVVLGVSTNDGNYYEVLAGIAPGERIIVGEIPG